MYKKLEEILKKLTGNVLIIGLDDILISHINQDKLKSLYSFETNEKKGLKIGTKFKTNKGKKVSIKKLRKQFKRKSVDYIILNYDTIVKYYKYIIKDTIYLNNNKLYIYSNDKYYLIKDTLYNIAEAIGNLMVS